MGLTNAQYNEIMEGYQQRQLANRRRTEEKMNDIYLREPLLKENNDAITSLYARIARARVNGDLGRQEELSAALAQLQQERSRLLIRHGLSEDDFLPVYTCPDCRDTGYIGNQQCHCFKQAVINVVYSQSNISSVLAQENFDTFTYDYYSPDDRDPRTGQTSLEAARRAEAECRRFIDFFDDKPKNLFFYGNTGVGKTFLTNCVAKELLEQGKSVIYFTSFQLFDILSRGVFDKDADAIAANRNIFDCDLLIIDDLGTELANAFTTSQLFLCVNERILRQKSTIISTNLSINEIAETYSERILSRITDNYTLIRLFGKDIRTEKRRRRMQQ